ncbi:hypothetical protein NHQ30_001409 [Ciborinia camelliae]|nr:hypothetical protein NHQ30_001409 [Ciborinia camelliae]
MTSITKPRPVLSRNPTEESIVDDGMKGKLKRDTISGKLKFWSGNQGSGNGIENGNGFGEILNNEEFKKMDKGNFKTDGEFVTGKDFDMEKKDLGEWEFSQDSRVDPLNWSPQRKTLAFFTLCLAFSIVGMQRLMFVSVNAIITTQFSISSTQTAALTGIAFIFSAISSPFWEMLSMKMGKRGIFIFSSGLMLVGSLWNMHVGSFGQFLVGRMMEGVGWGAFEGLVGGAVGEMYFKSQLPIRLTILSTIDLFFTWGTPIIGGYLSQTVGGYGNQIMVMNIVQVFSILLLIIAFPETSFNRSSHPTPPTSLPPTGTLKTWLKTLHLMPYWGKPSKEELLKPLNGLISPITLLTFLFASLPIASTYAIALSLSGFLSASPLFTFPSQIGYIFTGPFLLSTTSYGLLSFISPGKSICTSSEKSSGVSPTRALRIALPGLIFFTTGIIAFSQYVSMTLIPQTMEVHHTVFVVANPAMDLSLRVVSLALGVAVAGSTFLGFAVERYFLIFQGLRGMRGDARDAGRERGREMGRGSGKRGLKRSHHVLQNLLTGSVIIAWPHWIEGAPIEKNMGDGVMVMGLRDTGLGVGVFAAVWGLLVVGGLWMLGERIAGMGVGMRREEGRGVEGQEAVYIIKPLEV